MSSSHNDCFDLALLCTCTSAKIFLNERAQFPNPIFQTSFVLNLLALLFQKSDFMSIGPLKVHNGNVSKFSSKTDKEVHQLIVELVRVKTELEMLIDGSLPPVCTEKFNSILFTSFR